MKISVEPHQIITMRSTWLLVAELADVFADAVEHGALARAVLHVGTVEPLHVEGIERGRHRSHGAHRVADRFEVAADVEHTGARGSGVRVVGEEVPRAEDDVVERGDGYEVADHRCALVGAFAEPDRRHLRQ